LVFVTSVLDYFRHILLKANIDLLASFLYRLFCRSLENGRVPSSLKSAYITPTVKKVGLDATDLNLKFYRSISNLSVVPINCLSDWFQFVLTVSPIE